MLLIFIFKLGISNVLANDCERISIEKKYIPQFAKHFKIEYYHDFKIVTVDQKKYLLTDKKINLNCNQNINIETPVKRVVLTSTTYLPALNILNQESSLIGFQEKKYIYSSKFNLNKVINIPYDLKVEQLVNVHPNLVMAFDDKLFQPKLERLFNDFNMALVLNKDSEEESPLARAEWLVFISSFYNKEDVAIKEFNKIRDIYLKLKNEIESFHLKKPQILLGEIQNGKWVFAGAKSDLGQMVNDAGGELVLNVNSRETQSISLEEMLHKKINPDIWLTNNLWKHREDILKNVQYRFFKSKKIYNNNLKLNEFGANDFWEMGMQRPDLMLSDLISIFYDKNLPLNWYKKLK